MTSVNDENRLETIARKYRKSGAEVILDPRTSEMPFDLGAYRPDILVKKTDGTGVVVEVKSSSDRLPIEKLTEIASIVRKSPGWRFVLVTLSDVSLPSGEAAFVTWDEIERMLDSVGTLLVENRLDAGVLLLWAAFEASMRVLAVQEGVPVERLPVIKLRDHLYSAGLIAIGDYAASKNFLRLRNAVAHGLVVALEKDVVAGFLDIARKCRSEWSGGAGSEAT